MISKELVDILILKRTIRFDQILVDLSLFNRDSQGRLVPSIMNATLLNRLDGLIYTLDFLVRTKQYIRETRSTNITGLSFHGYTPTNENESSHVLYLENYLSGILGKEYTINPTIFHFKNRNYRTQTQKQIDDNFRVAIIAAVLSSFLTALLTSFLPSVLWTHENNTIYSPLIHKLKHCKKYNLGTDKAIHAFPKKLLP
ncbi:MAG: hypothetical protein HGA38_02355 [Candidatus Moranbacteria bacterium]|nr:hypothetical protein [Candidatus Moranbacteria bacterium]